MTKHAELFALLASPFEPGEVKHRPAGGGRQLSYITARTVMNRLDTVLGPESWWDSYEASEKSVLCRLTIRLPDGQELTKADAGGYAGMADSGDDDKSGYSDAFKRAAVKFGIGRHLYGDGIPNFGPASPAPAPAPQPPPTLTMAAPADFRPGRNGMPRRESSAPSTGKALYAWAKDATTRHGFSMLRVLSAFGRNEGFPSRIVDWTEEQARAGYYAGSLAIREHNATPVS